MPWFNDGAEDPVQQYVVEALDERGADRAAEIACRMRADEFWKSVACAFTDRPVRESPPRLAVRGGEPFVIAVYRDDDPYLQGKPEATGLIVIPFGEAHRLAELWRAIANRGTWGDLIAAIDDPITLEYIYDVEWEGQPVDAGVWFDLADTNDGFAPDPRETMLLWMPDSVKQLGTVVDGDWLHLPESALESVVAALAAEGNESYMDLGNVVLACCPWASKL